METHETVESLRNALAPLRVRGPVALVSTMGALHRGHRALVEAARGRAATVVVSIFVNPTQFGDARDLAAYPRTLEADRALLEAAGADLLFLPSVAEIYPEGDETVVETTRLSRAFHGAVRPGHFRGVATVVTKLINVVGPDLALFGEKDYQQLAVIRRMVRDLHMGVEIMGVPTVREADGLALSSRNVRLSPEDRAAAVVLKRALDEGAGVVREGCPAWMVREAVTGEILGEPRAKSPEVDVVDAATFEPLEGPIRVRAGLMVSARFGDVLLIDQMEAMPPQEEP